MTFGSLIDDSADARVLQVVGHADLPQWLAAQRADVRGWLAEEGFTADAGQVVRLPGGTPHYVAGLGDRGRWDWASLPGGLPPGSYRIVPEPEPVEADAAALGWASACYEFDRYRSLAIPTLRRLRWPSAANREKVTRELEAVLLVRDLVTTPANDLGPAELCQAAVDLAAEFGAEVRTIVGDELLAENYPTIHAVGRASSRPPVMVDLRWGAPGDRKITIVGKGVCFDSGGLNTKTADSMLLMKKDMGGAAHALALARLIMAARLPVRLRMLIGAVENAIGGDAMRPLDIVRTRKGITVEIGHTDAEGRLVLSDLLAEGSTETPDLLIDFATLTSAARIALGPDLPAFFANRDATAARLEHHAAATDDPLYRLPLWQRYRADLVGGAADLRSVTGHTFGGAIYAALFLESFVGEECDWVHVDLFAWNRVARPGRPAGGEAQTLRAVFALVEERAAA